MVGRPPHSQANNPSTFEHAPRTASPRTPARAPNTITLLYMFYARRTGGRVLPAPARHGVRPGGDAGGGERPRGPGPRQGAGHVQLPRQRGVLQAARSTLGCCVQQQPCAPACRAAPPESPSCLSLCQRLSLSSHLRRALPPLFATSSGSPACSHVRRARWSAR